MDPNRSAKKVIENQEEAKIMEKEVKHAIKSLRLNKAPG